MIHSKILFFLFDKIIGIYCLIDDLLKGIGHFEDNRRKESESKIITTAIEGYNFQEPDNTLL